MGFGSHHVYAAINQLPINGRAEFKDIGMRLSSSFDVSANWHSGEYNSRYVRDVNNDGRADILGFGDAGVITQRMPTITQPIEQ